MDTLLTETEEKSLIGLLYNHVTFGTTLQVFGEVATEHARIDALRVVLEKLLVKYSLIGNLSPEELLLMGIVSELPREKLETWALNGSNKHLQLRAKYFLREKA